MRSKTSKQTALKTKVYFTIINLFKQGYTLTEIAKKLKISKQNLNNKIKPLKVLGIVNLIGYGVWNVNEKNIPKLTDYLESKVVKTIRVGQQGNTFTSLQNTVRSHAFVFTIKIDKNKNWKRYLTNNSPKEIKGGTAFIFKNHKIHIFKNSIVIYYPTGLSYFAQEPIQSFRMAFYDCVRLLVGLENLFHIRNTKGFKINSNYWIKPSRHHYSLINNELAKKLNQDKVKLEIRDDKGKMWMLIDNSFNLNECEYIDPKKNIVDATGFKRFFNEIRKEPDILEIMKKENEELKFLTSELQQRIKEVALESINQTMIMEKLINDRRI